MKKIFQTIAAAIRWKKRIPCDEWVEKHITFTNGARPGKFSHDTSPAWREVYRATSQRGVEQVTVMTVPQNGKTTMQTLVSLHRGYEQGLPQLYVGSTVEGAKQWLKEDLLPKLEACDLLQEQLPSKAQRRYKLKSNFYTLRDYWIKGVGGKTDTGIKQIAVALLLLDELDAWTKYGGNRSKGKSKSARESPFYLLAKARVSTYRLSGEALIVAASTPSVEDGPIYQEFLDGTQETFRPVCPCCKKPWPHRLTISDYDLTPGHRPLPERRKHEARKLDDWDLTKLKREASWKCPRKGCNGRVRNNDWGWSVAEGARRENGGWVVENPQGKSPSHRSFHLSKHVGLPESSDWIGEIACAYVRALYVEGGLHDFQNKFEGWPYLPNKIKRDEQEIDNVLDYSPPYTLRNLGKVRELPEGCWPVCIFSSADVQATHIVFVIRAIDVHGRSWLLHAGQHPGIDVVGLAEKIKELRWRVTPSCIRPDGELSVFELCVDAGYKAGLSGSVYEAARQYPELVVPVVGRDRKNHRMLEAVGIESREDTSVDPPLTIEARTIDDDLFKRKLYYNRIKSAGSQHWSGWFLPQNIREHCPGYCEQLLSERQGDDGKWSKRGPNDFGDAEKYTAAQEHFYRDDINELRRLWREEQEKNAVK